MISVHVRTKPHHANPCGFAASMTGSKNPIEAAAIGGGVVNRYIFAFVQGSGSCSSNGRSNCDPPEHAIPAHLGPESQRTGSLKQALLDGTLASIESTGTSFPVTEEARGFIARLALWTLSAKRHCQTLFLIISKFCNICDSIHELLRDVDDRRLLDEGRWSAFYISDVLLDELQG